MNTRATPTIPRRDEPAANDAREHDAGREDTQPEATGSGASPGSPAAPVMKQFQKTDAERGEPSGKP
jgi:hypothetical protein